MPNLPGWEVVAGSWARLRSFSRTLLRGDAVESEIREEFLQHIELRAADLVRGGVSEEAATRQARREFGHLESHRAEARDSRGFRALDRIYISWLDARLAVRMLVKHPLLSAAAIFALAVGIPVGLAPAHLAKAVEAPLPGDRENRIRAVRLWNPATTRIDATAYEDFAFWATELQSFSALAGFRQQTFGVGSEDGRAALIAGAHLSPGVFAMLRAAPALGRTLTATDAAPGATAVAVLGHDLWTTRFGADPGILGRAIRIGREKWTVVGVMPAGFRFPANEQLWVPLVSVPPGADRAPVRIIGRLADGVSAEQAQAELNATGLAPVANPPDSRARLRPEVVPFGLLYLGLGRGGFDAMPEYRYVQLLAFALLLVACGNVALLVFARTATRFREMAIRTALGATRTRIVGQSVVETLVLAVVAAGLGVLATEGALRQVNLAALAGEAALPYWLSLNVTANDLLWALGLAAASATVAGVGPAIWITGRPAQLHLRGRSGIRFGWVTGSLIVADIAVAVAAVGLALAIADRATGLGESDQVAGIPAAEYLAVEFRMPDDGRSTDGIAKDGGGAAGALAERMATAQRALVAALSTEPGIAGVAVGSVLPRMEHRSQPFELEGVVRPPEAPPQWVRYARVDAGFFAGLGHQVVAGRDFTPADVDGPRRVAIVNTAFGTRLLEGADPIGRRFQLPASGAGADSAWYEIVGVVGHLGVNMQDAGHGEAVYLPAPPGGINPVQVGLHTTVPPASLAPRIRAVAARVAPDLVMGNPVVLSDVHQGDWYLIVGVAAGLTLLVGILIALAASGIYAMLSLSVSERTREIGIRTAIGAPRRALVLTILRRSLAQIGAGALLGVPVAAFVIHQLTEGPAGGPTAGASVLVAVALAVSLVLVVGVVSCAAPTRRILAVEASEAMRSDV